MATVAVCVAACLLTIRLSSERASAMRTRIFRDRTNDGLFSAAARGRGLLLTAGNFHLVQLRTRRAVLLDGGALDLLPYTLEAAPEVDRILREVYGVDLFHPPEEARGSGRVPPLATRRAWEGYSLGKWQAIRQAFGVTQVLTPADWQLVLPPVAQSRDYLLYEIP
jgi:hypothetical protein